MVANWFTDDDDDYQSHHTGIETYLIYFLNLIILATNRTTLELKRINIYWLTIHLSNYQSHHTGIETNVEAYTQGFYVLPIAPHWN